MLLLLLAALLTSPLAASAAWFLEVLPHPELAVPVGAEAIIAQRLSRDGSTVTGYGAVPLFSGGGHDANHAFLWHPAAGTRRVFDPDPGDPQSASDLADQRLEGHALSANGGVVGVDAWDLTGAPPEVGNVFLEDGTSVGIWICPIAGVCGSRVIDLSSDGGHAAFTRITPVGFSEAALLDTATGVVTDLGDLIGGTSFPPPIDWASHLSNARAISADGSVLVGESAEGDYLTGALNAFAWTQAGGMVALPDLEPGRDSFVSDVSADGTTVVGYHPATASSPTVGIRWVGGVASGFAPGAGGATLRFPVAVSGDGTTVVGTGADGYPVIWTESAGAEPLVDVFGDLSLPVAGWSGWVVLDLSDDGLTVLGAGRNPAFEARPWVAHLPEPSFALGLLCSAVLLVAEAGRRG